MSWLVNIGVNKWAVCALLMSAGATVLWLALCVSAKRADRAWKRAERQWIAARRFDRKAVR